MTLLAVAVGLAYVTFLAIAAATDPQPARAARSLARENAYAAIIVGLSLAAYYAVRRRDALQAKPTSFLAVWSTLIAVLNPAVVGVLCGALGVRGIDGGGASEMYSFVVGAVALAAGIVAAIRIRQSRGRMSGMRLAVAGVVVGALWVGFWVIFAVVFQ